MRAVWSAGDYPALAERLQPAAETLLDVLGCPPAARLLDVAAGTGNVALAAARRGAAVTASDLTPRMVELGRALTGAAGATIQWVEADAEDLPFDPAAFDLVVSSFGVIFAPRPDAATAELHRVLQPGGRLGLTAWVPGGHMARMTDAMRPFLPAPPPEAPDPLAWGDEATARARLAGAFEDVTVRQATLPWRFDTPQAVRAFLERYSPTHAAVAAMLGPDRAGAMFDAIETFYTAEAGPGGRVDVHAEYVVITGTRR